MGKKENRFSILLILLCLFVVMLGYGILLPTLPYFTERLALKDQLDTDSINFHIGLLTSVYPFFQLLFVVVWGKLSDKYGRKPIIIFGLIGFVIMQLLTGLATSLTMLYVARIFGGIFSSSVIPVSNAYLSDITSQKRRTKIMAWSGMAVSSGVIFGPVIGGFLSQSNLNFAFSFGQLHFNRFSVPFILVSLLGLISLFMVIKWLKAPKRAATVTFKSKSPRMSFTKRFIVLLILSFVLQFSITLFETVFSIFGKEKLQFTVNQIGIGFMLCGAVMAFLQPVFANFGKRFLRVKNQIGLGFFIIGISLILFPYLNTELTIYTIIIIFALGGALVTPNLLAAVSLMSKENTGRNISFQTSANSIGQILGPILGTSLISGSYYLPFLTAGVVVLLAVGLVCFFLN